MQSYRLFEALDGEELLPIELLECGITPAGALDHEELLVVELLECGTTPAGALDHKDLFHDDLEVEAASPSCKRVTSSSAGYDCVINATVREGRVWLPKQHHRLETPRSRGVGTPRVIQHH